MNLESIKIIGIFQILIISLSLFIITQDFKTCKIEQLELSKKEAVILLENDPGREEALKYEADKPHLNDDAKIQSMKDSLNTWKKPRAELHMGLHHKPSFKPLPFPEPLLVILFVHRHAVTDESSLNSFKKFISSDFIPSMPQVQDNYNIYKPSWLGPHLVTNVVEIARNTVGMTNNGAIQSHILVNPEENSTRLRLAILYNTTKSFINILLKYGGYPKLPNTTELDEFRNYLDTTVRNGNPRTATEVILDALPHVLQYHKKNIKQITQGLPPKSKCMSNKWEDSVTFNDFNIYIPTYVTAGNRRSLQGIPIETYFDGVFFGTIPFSSMINCVPVPVENTKSKKTSTKNAEGNSGSSSPKKRKVDIQKVEENLKAIDDAVSQIPQDQVEASIRDRIRIATAGIRDMISENK